MKFLLELVACCGGGAVSGKPVVKEEARLLASSVPPPSTAAHRKKRGRTTPTGSGSAVDWRPSLTAICEESVLSERIKKEKENQDRKVESAAVRPPSPASDRSLKRKTTSAPKSRSYSSGREEARRPSIHTVVMPTFSPAPFMF